MSHFGTCKTGQAYPAHPSAHCAECEVISTARAAERDSYAEAISEEIDGRATIRFVGDSPYVLVTREVLVGVVEHINALRGITGGITHIGE